MAMAVATEIRISIEEDTIIIIIMLITMITIMMLQNKERK